jgi:hypothetical protein
MTTQHLSLNMWPQVKSNTMTKKTVEFTVIYVIHEVGLDVL